MHKVTTTIMIQSPPFTKIEGKEGIDLSLVCAAFEQNVNLIFTGEGVFHLLNNQKEDCFDDKLQDKQLKALVFYDIETIYAEQESLQKYALLQANLIKNVAIINMKAINTISRQSQHVVIF